MEERAGLFKKKADAVGKRIMRGGQPKHKAPRPGTRYSAVPSLAPRLVFLDSSVYHILQPH